MNIACIGAIVNSALYLAAVFIAGLLTHNPWAWMCAIMAMGLTYLSYIAAIPRLIYRDDVEFDPTPRMVMPHWQRVAHDYTTILSITLGAGAGLFLLF